MMIRCATTEDVEQLVELRHELWPEGPKEEHRGELGRYFGGEAREPDLIGFCELSIRAYAEGCATDRVGYLEGWFVVASARRRGLGRALVRAGEDWARKKGCTEFASDADAENRASALAHQAIGFEDVGFVRCFRKDL